MQQRGSYRRDLLQPGLLREQVERGVGSGAGERVGHEGRPMHQRLLRIIRPECIERDGFMAREVGVNVLYGVARNILAGVREQTGALAFASAYGTLLPSDASNCLC